MAAEKAHVHFIANGFSIYAGDGRSLDPAMLLRYLRRLRPDVVITTIQPDETAALTRRAVTRSNGVTARYVPLGVDTRLFHPPADKRAAKGAFGYRNRFVVLCDARNQPRKLLPRTLDVFRRFASDKSDVVLHLHCDPYDPTSRAEDYSYDVVQDVQFLGLGGKVRFTRGMSILRGVSLERLASLYRAADVHLLTSSGEGFGIPTLQAAAAGAVPFAAAYAANRELLDRHGEAIRVGTFIRRDGGWRCAFIDIGDAAARLRRLYRDRARLRSKAQAARRFAESYDWGVVVRQWDDLLEREVPRVRSRNGGRAKTQSRRLPV